MLSRGPSSSAPHHGGGSQRPTWFSLACDSTSSTCPKESMGLEVVTYLSVMFFFKVLAVDYDFAALAASHLAAWRYESSDLLV
jgi:hypothetical protein